MSSNTACTYRAAKVLRVSRCAKRETCSCADADVGVAVGTCEKRDNDDRRVPLRKNPLPPRLDLRTAARVCVGNRFLAHALLRFRQRAFTRANGAPVPRRERVYLPATVTSFLYNSLSYKIFAFSSFKRRVVRWMCHSLCRGRTQSSNCCRINMFTFIEKSTRETISACRSDGNKRRNHLRWSITILRG